MPPALAYLERHRERFLHLLFDYLRIPSVSAQKEFHGEARRAAEFVRARLDEAGMQSGLYEGFGLPTVHGRRVAGDRPTFLLYGHYDVQPPEPLDLWETPPFAPTMVDGEIRARGCADDKGPSLALILAAECWMKGAGDLPVDLKVVIEGEEECGGDNVGHYLRTHAKDLAADALVIADTDGLAPGVPALTYALRGICAAEVTLEGPQRDLHSGTYGGAIANPATALARLVATLHDAKGRVAIEGFYEGVREPDAEERRRLAAIPFDERAFLAETGSLRTFGEEGYTTTERRWARPTCEINGIFGGYQGEGSKTIVPARAGCKITCRLVPGQDPARVMEALETHARRHCPPGVALAFHRGHMAPAVFTDPDTRWARVAREALERAFGKPAALVRAGGSIPIVSRFKELLGVEPLLLGTYRPGERAHSPNERYHPDDFFAAIRAGIHLFRGA